MAGAECIPRLAQNPLAGVVVAADGTVTPAPAGQLSQ
jgi:hypothetical protein